MTAAKDRLVVGLVVAACGVGALVQGWPLSSAVIGVGCGLVISGVIRLFADRGDPR